MRESEFSFAPQVAKEEWYELVSRLEGASEGVKKEDWQHFTPAFLDKMMVSLDRDRVVGVALEHQTLKREQKLSQPEATVHIPTALPITVFNVGDIHHGSIFTNELLWQEMRQEILETPGVYVIFTHNLIDNAIPARFPDGMLNSTIHPALQFKFMREQIKELDQAGKVLAALEAKGCHSGWAETVAGIDATQLLFEGVSFPILENGGVINLVVGEQTYTGLLFHKQGPFHSSMNPEHSLRQNRRFSGLPADFVFGAHYHESVATQDWEGYKHLIKKVAYVQAGTFKGHWPDKDKALNDEFVVTRWGKTGEPPGNSITLYPFQHDIEANLGFESSFRYHEALRIALWLETLGEKERLLQMMVE